MRVLLLLTSSLFAIGCGSSPSTPSPESVPPKNELADLEMGVARATLEQRFPGAFSDGKKLSWMGTYAGRAANITLFLDDNQLLDSVNVAFQSSYASMDACGGDWKAIRSDMDRFYGRSQSDNLAAYWSTGTVSIRLSCDPDEDSGASLTAGFQRPDSE